MTAITAAEKNLTPELEMAQLNALKVIDEIEKSLTTMDPMLPLHCKTIRDELMKYEELVHILPDEKIKIFMAGMKKYKNIQLVAEAAKTRGKSKVTADDL